MLDVLDALVCLSEPTFPGCLIPVKPVGLFKMQDEAGIDDTIICVPLADPSWNAYDEVDELPKLLRSEIEQHKRVVVDGWCSRQDALDEIAAARERFRGMDDRPTRPAIGGRIPGHQRNQ